MQTVLSTVQAAPSSHVYCTPGKALKLLPPPPPVPEAQAALERRVDALATASAEHDSGRASAGSEAAGSGAGSGAGGSGEGGSGASGGSPDGSARTRRSSARGGRRCVGPRLQFGTPAAVTAR